MRRCWSAYTRRGRSAFKLLNGTTHLHHQAIAIFHIIAPGCCPHFFFCVYTARTVLICSISSLFLAESQAIAYLMILKLAQYAACCNFSMSGLLYGVLDFRPSNESQNPHHWYWVLLSRIFVALCQTASSAEAEAKLSNFDNDTSLPPTPQKLSTLNYYFNAFQLLHLLVDGSSKTSQWASHSSKQLFTSTMQCNYRCCNLWSADWKFCLDVVFSGHDIHSDCR